MTPAGATDVGEYLRAQAAIIDGALERYLPAAGECPPLVAEDGLDVDEQVAAHEAEVEQIEIGPDVGVPREAAVAVAGRPEPAQVQAVGREEAHAPRHQPGRPRASGRLRVDGGGADRTPNGEREDQQDARDVRGDARPAQNARSLARAAAVP